MTDDLPDQWAQALLNVNLVDPRRKEPTPSLNRLAEASGVAVETVRRMVHGMGEPQPAKVRAVADALRVDVRVVSSWVNHARAVREPYEAPDDADLLDDDERDAVNRVIRLLAASKKGARSAESTTNPRRSDVGLAAHKRATKSSKPTTRRNRD